MVGDAVYDVGSIVLEYKGEGRFCAADDDIEVEPFRARKCHNKCNGSGTRILWIGGCIYHNCIPIG